MRGGMVFVGLVACADVDDPHEHNVHEVITRVNLTFIAPGGEETLYAWTDPENDGSPVIDAIVLTEGATYEVSVGFVNELSSPPEEITEEVAQEAEEHQVFFLGDAVGPIVTHAYADADADGFPVGLDNEVTAVAAGDGSLQIVLRHLPEQDGVAVKTGDLAAVVASDGLAAIPGDSDVDVEFPITVETAR